MVPSTLATVVGFLIFVAPGVPWAERVERRQSWRRTEASFRQIARGVVWSAWFSLPATLLTLLGLRVVFPERLDAIRLWLLGGAQLSGWTVIALVSSAFVELLMALLIMLLAWRWLANKLYGASEASDKSAWELFLHHNDQTARVYLSDGTSWVGGVRSFSTDNDWPAREIVLADPRHVDANGDAGPIFPGRVILPSNVIKAVFAAGDEPTIDALIRPQSRTRSKEGSQDNSPEPGAKKRQRHLEI